MEKDRLRFLTVMFLSLFSISFPAFTFLLIDYITPTPPAMIILLGAISLISIIFFIYITRKTKHQIEEEDRNAR